MTPRNLLHVLKLRRWLPRGRTTPPNDDGRPWQALDMGRGRRTDLSESAAELLLRLIGTGVMDGPGDVHQVEHAAALSELKRSGLLSTAGAGKDHYIESLRRMWERKGWVSSAQVRAGTETCPPVQSTRGTGPTDAEPTQPEQGEHRTCPGTTLSSLELTSGPHGSGRGECPAVGSAQLELHSLLARIGEHASTPKVIDRDSTGGSVATSRLQPVDVYLLNQSVDGMAPGWWKVRRDVTALDQLTIGVDPADVRRVLPGPMSRSPFADPSGILVFATTFDRAIQRDAHRPEFLSLYLGIGQEIGFAELLLDSAGYDTFGHHGVDNAALGQMLEKNIFATAFVSAVLFKKRQRSIIGGAPCSRDG